MVPVTLTLVLILRLFSSCLINALDLLIRLLTSVSNCSLSVWLVSLLGSNWPNDRFGSTFLLSLTSCLNERLTGPSNNSDISFNSISILVSCFFCFLISLLVFGVSSPFDASSNAFDSRRLPIGFPSDSSSINGVCSLYLRPQPTSSCVWTTPVQSGQILEKFEF